MRIAEYLRELEARLPSARRQRFLAETEEHLRDAAAMFVRGGLDRPAAEERAVAVFGPVDDVARRLSEVSAVHAVRRATVVGLLAAGATVVPLYGIPENTLPPAPWDERPALLALFVWLGIGSWLLALGLGAAALAASVNVHGRTVAAQLLAASAGASGLSGALGLAALVTWLSYAGTWAGWKPALAVPAALACTSFAAGAAVWARNRCALTPSMRERP